MSRCRRFVRALSVAAWILLLAGCGQTGALYLPDTATGSETGPGQSAPGSGVPGADDETDDE